MGDGYKWTAKEIYERIVEIKARLADYESNLKKLRNAVKYSNSDEWKRNIAEDERPTVQLIWKNYQILEQELQRMLGTKFTMEGEEYEFSPEI